MTFKLTGWKALCALAGLLAVAVIRYDMQSAALETRGVEAIQRWLALEAARSTLPEMAKAVAAGAGQDLEQMVNDLGQDNFEVLSVTRHGMGERIVARVEYRHRSRAPLGEPAVRYLRMSYSLSTGWRIHSETSALSYHLAAF